MSRRRSRRRAPRATARERPGFCASAMNSVWSTRDRSSESSSTGLATYEVGGSAQSSPPSCRMMVGLSPGRADRRSFRALSLCSPRCSSESPHRSSIRCRATLVEVPSTSRVTTRIARELQPRMTLTLTRDTAPDQAARDGCREVRDGGQHPSRPSILEPNRFDATTIHRGKQMSRMRPQDLSNLRRSGRRRLRAGGVCRFARRPAGLRLRCASER